MILVAFDSTVRCLSGFFLEPGVLVSKKSLDITKSSSGSASFESFQN